MIDFIWVRIFMKVSQFATLREPPRRKERIRDMTTGSPQDQAATLLNTGSHTNQIMPLVMQRLQKDNKETRQLSNAEDTLSLILSSHIDF